jgi:ribosomal protein L11 methylase PrmA
MKQYPAIDVRTTAPDLLLATVDDFSPTAVEDTEPGTVRIFFSSAADRDAAQRALAARWDVTPIEVSDEDWARRSQEGLTPVTVGRLTIFPGPLSVASSPQPPASSPQPLASSPQPPAASPLALVIPPSMGFGTGHHATTRLCLAALQAMDLTNQVVLDVGTGSGVLALAAGRLGAARASGIDYDPDAIQAANENLELNPSVISTTFEVADLAATPLPTVDLITANLTGVVLVRSAAVLLGAVRAGGVLILSGLLLDERDEVCRAFAPAAVVWEREEDGWVGLMVKKA